jgi:Na+-translocating ferredoxin:NAD+ oxidoreductase RnfE subunit
MLRKIGMWLDRVLWTMIASGAILTFTGGLLVNSQDKGWGIGLFLFGLLVVAPYAANRIKALNRKLSKDIEGIPLMVTLTLWCIFTPITILVQLDTAAFTCMLITSIGLFIIAIWLEAFPDWTRHANANG